MAVYFDPYAGALAVTSDDCPDCGKSFYRTGCEAPRCTGLGCEDCGNGCDLEFGDEGQCAMAIATEPDAERDWRITAQRAAFGMAPL
jgi:hypothetical protein